MTFELLTYPTKQVTYSDFAADKNGDKIRIFGGYISGVGYTNSQQVYDIKTDTWSFGSPTIYSMVVYNVQSGINDKNLFYLLDEYYSSGAYTSRITKYNAITNQFTVIRGLPYFIAGNAILYDDNGTDKIFFNGGEIANGDIQAKSLIYNTSNGTFQVVADKPTAVRNQSIFLNQKEIHVCGGKDSTNVITSIDETYGYNGNYWYLSGNFLYDFYNSRIEFKADKNKFLTFGGAYKINNSNVFSYEMMYFDPYLWNYDKVTNEVSPVNGNRMATTTDIKTGDVYLKSNGKFYRYENVVAPIGLSGTVHSESYVENGDNQFLTKNWHNIIEGRQRFQFENFDGRTIKSSVFYNTDTKDAILKTFPKQLDYTKTYRLEIWSKSESVVDISTKDEIGFNVTNNLASPVSSQVYNVFTQQYFTNTTDSDVVYPIAPTTTWKHYVTFLVSPLDDPDNYKNHLVNTNYVGILPSETTDNINLYYKNLHNSSTSRLVHITESQLIPVLDGLDVDRGLISNVDIKSTVSASFERIRALQVDAINSVSSLNQSALHLLRNIKSIVSANASINAAALNAQKELNTTMNALSSVIANVNKLSNLKSIINAQSNISPVLLNFDITLNGDIYAASSLNTTKLDALRKIKSNINASSLLHPSSLEINKTFSTNVNVISNVTKEKLNLLKSINGTIDATTNIISDINKENTFQGNITSSSIINDASLHLLKSIASDVYSTSNVIGNIVKAYPLIPNDINIVTLTYAYLSLNKLVDGQINAASTIEVELLKTYSIQSSIHAISTINHPDIKIAFNLPIDAIYSNSSMSHTVHILRSLVADVQSQSKMNQLNMHRKRNISSDVYSNLTMTATIKPFKALNGQIVVQSTINHPNIVMHHGLNAITNIDAIIQSELNVYKTILSTVHANLTMDVMLNRNKLFDGTIDAISNVIGQFVFDLRSLHSVVDIQSTLIGTFNKKVSLGGNITSETTTNHPMLLAMRGIQSETFAYSMVPFALVNISKTFESVLNVNSLIPPIGLKNNLF